MLCREVEGQLYFTPPIPRRRVYKFRRGDWRTDGIKTSDLLLFCVYDMKTITRISVTQGLILCEIQRLVLSRLELAGN
jgi:hypothetical protein